MATALFSDNIIFSDKSEFSDKSVHLGAIGESITENPAANAVELESKNDRLKEIRAPAAKLGKNDKQKPFRAGRLLCRYLTASAYCLENSSH